MSSGIYAIENTVTGMIYVGSAGDIFRRWMAHTSSLRLNKHINPKLQAAWNEYGADAFVVNALEFCEYEKLAEREQHYLDTYMPLGFTYNIARRSIRSEQRIKRQPQPQPTPKPDDYIDPATLDDVEKLIVKVHRLGGNIRVAFLMAALSESDAEFNEYVQDIQKYLIRKALKDAA